MPTPGEIRIFQICDGTTGNNSVTASATGTGVGPVLITYDGISTGAKMKSMVNAYVGVRLIQPQGTITGTQYEVEFKLYKSNTKSGAGAMISPFQVGSTVTTTLASTASPTATIFAIFTASGAADNTPADVFDFSVPNGPNLGGGAIGIDMRIRGKRTIGGVDYFSAWRRIAGGASGDDFDVATANGGLYAGRTCY